MARAEYGSALPSDPAIFCVFGVFSTICGIFVVIVTVVILVLVARKPKQTGSKGADGTAQEPARQAKCADRHECAMAAGDVRRLFGNGLAFGDKLGRNALADSSSVEIRANHFALRVEDLARRMTQALGFKNILFAHGISLPCPK